MKQISRPFNIVILPPKNISQKAISISKKLRVKGGLFTLGNKVYFPHVTLYMAEFPLKNIPKIKSLLQKFVIKIKPFNLNSSDYRQSPGGYVDVAYKKSKKIKDIQKSLIDLLNPLREGLIMESDKERLHTSIKTEQKNIKLYGYRYAKSQFDPHITFTKLKEYNTSAVAMPKTDFSFKAESVAIFSKGEHGTCNKLIKKFNLQ